MESGEPHRLHSDWDDPETMVSVDEARTRILSAFSALPPVECALLDALGLVLAENIQSTVDVPPFRNSAMDGYAVRADDSTCASAERPLLLTLNGEVAAGRAALTRLVPGTAMRIMTGAPLPEGSNAVIRFEEVVEFQRSGAETGGEASTCIQLSRAVHPNENVRQAGEDVARGAMVLSAGTIVGPMHTALMAAIGKSTVWVVPRPIVAILSTGDEVVDAATNPGPAQIWNSNGPMLAAMTRLFGGTPIQLGIAGDTVDAITERLAACDRADLLVTSGGVSVGDFDLVKQVLQREGLVELWQVRMKPGKPLAFGMLGGTPLLGLPGNPAAAAVAFSQFGRPAIRKMLNYPSLAPRVRRARLVADIENRGRRRHYVRGTTTFEQGEYVARPVGGNRSGALTGLAAANCFIIISEEIDHAIAGSFIDVELFEDTQFDSRD